MFWIVGLALIASWFVAVVFTPYLGVKILPAIPKWKAAMPPSMTRLAITAFASCWPRYRQKMARGRVRGRHFHSGRARHGAGKKTVLPDLRSPGSAG
jgi:multidrug efflux pump subunit AcrB